MNPRIKWSPIKEGWVVCIVGVPMIYGPFETLRHIRREWATVLEVMEEFKGWKSA